MNRKIIDRLVSSIMILECTNVFCLHRIIQSALNDNFCQIVIFNTGMHNPMCEVCQ